ncbi:Phosphatidylinositol glycan anchor biosynthesis class U protein-like protein [Drosera capensis]
MESGDARPSPKPHSQPLRFWPWAISSVVLRLILIYSSETLGFNLSSRPEISTPLTSLRRLNEGYWLKQAGLSPYAGSMYHGSPLLLTVLGPLTATRVDGHFLCSFLFVIADFISAILIRAMGNILQSAYGQYLESLGLGKLFKISERLCSGDIAALVYLWNPLTILTCLGSSTMPIENFFVVLCLYGACARFVPLAAFGWLLAAHLSLYPSILILPVIFLLAQGSDAPPSKLFLKKDSSKTATPPSEIGHHHVKMTNDIGLPPFSWRVVTHFLLWASIWASYILILCAFSVKQKGGLREMFRRTYGFMLSVEDLAPNIGVQWYFFAEVFDFFRSFFLIVFHINILFMILPLAIRLKHRPCFLAFVYIAISSMLKSYPSGTGNANFYYATAMAYACFQIVLVVESVSAMLNHDRMLKKLSAPKDEDSK